MHPTASFPVLDHRRHVVGIAIDRHAANEVRELDPFRLQIAIIRADQRGELLAEWPPTYNWRVPAIAT